MVIVRQPIYQQLSRALRDLLRGGEFARGDKFLTERQVCERFDVSRATANKALANLMVEGVLEFKKGIGTFIRGDVLEYDMRSLVSFTDRAKAAGRKPSTRVVRFDRVDASEAGDEAVAALRLRGEEKLYYIERLRLADGVPVILERRHVVARHCPDLARADVAGSLYALWIDRYGLDIDGAEEAIRAVNIEGADSKAMDLADGAAGFLVISTGLLLDDHPLWHERTLYRGDAYEFKSRLGGVCPSRPVVGAFRS